MFKFIHTADIHLDSPLRGLDRYEGSPADRIRSATRQAFEGLIDLAINEQIDFLLIAGDVYDGDWRDFNSGLFFNQQMSRLREKGINVYMVSGNHDAESQISKTLTLPENVFVFPTDKPSTKVLEELKVAIHGQGYASRAVSENMAKIYPEVIDDMFNIGLLHTSLNGYEDHEPYAPCSMEDLQAKKYDYWALGHVHNEEVLHDQEPVVLFPGCIQGRHIRETGTKGCMLVRVEYGEIQLEHQELAVLNWACIKVDAGECSSPEEVIEKILDEITEEVDKSSISFSAFRIIVSGATEVHAELQNARERWINEVRARVTDMFGESVWVEKIKINTSRLVNEEELKKSEGIVGSLLQYIDELEGDDHVIEEMAAELQDVEAKLPSGLIEDTKPVALNSPESVHERLKEAKELLLLKLLGREQ